MLAQNSQRKEKSVCLDKEEADLLKYANLKRKAGLSTTSPFR